MSLGLAILSFIAVLAILAAIFATAQIFVTRRMFRRNLPWRPLFWVTAIMGALYAALNVALVPVLANYAQLLLAPVGVVAHALLVVKFIPDDAGSPLWFREAIFGQALTILFFAALQIPLLINLLRGLS